MIKVYCTGPGQISWANNTTSLKISRICTRRVPDQEVEQLSRRYPVEDITDLYAIRLGEQTIETSQPRMSSQGRSISHPSSKRGKPLARHPDFAKRVVAILEFLFYISGPRRGAKDA